MLYQIKNGTVSFGADTVLDSINFEIKEGEKIAVVGRNGCGKTTLLRLMMGEVDLARVDGSDSGIHKSGNPVIGYLRQMSFVDDSITLREELKKASQPAIDLQATMNKYLERLNSGKLDEEETHSLAKKYASAEERFAHIGGYDYEREAEIVVRQFGFLPADFDKQLSTFSGGQRTKLAFAKLLLSKPDILLLDEPTNHLDIATVEWLEGYLKTYRSAVVIVSHDRRFLDKVVDTVYEIEYGEATRYVGNYSDFVRRKQENWEKQMKDHLLQKKEIERLSAIVERFKHHPTKVSMAWSKLKQIEHMTVIDAPERYDLRSFRTNCIPERSSGKEVLDVRSLKIGYDKVLAEITFTLMRGRKLAVLGANGTGKSTLLKTIIGNVPPLGGHFKLGHQVRIGYFDQQAAVLTGDKTVLDDFWGEFPDMTQTEARGLLGSFLFNQDEVFKPVGKLSGGERGRLALAKILRRKPNLLILDEPTNHMDIVGKEALEQMLSCYTGTVLFVSHDRFFVSEVADCLLVINNDQSAEFYDYGYNEYEEYKTKLAAQTNNTIAAKVNKGGKKDSSYIIKDNEPPVMNEYFRRKEAARQERRLLTVEKLIEEAEAEIKSQEELMNHPDNVSDYVALTNIQSEIDSINGRLEQLLAEWGELSEALSN